MLDRDFWKDARSCWCVKASDRIEVSPEGMGGPIAPEFDGFPFQVDIGKTEQNPEEKLEESPEFDGAAFDEYMEKQDIPSYIQCIKLLQKHELEEEMSLLYKELAERMGVLQEVLVKYKNIYRTDMTEFYEYYIPEALSLAASYLEYIDIGIGKDILENAKKDVSYASKALLTAINEKINEIAKFASMETQAEAKALEQMMAQDGYVDPSNRLK